ncbi:hypothetical protein GOV05_05165 [Candidatus Woesearchaeota archaeon]|nr:hypothetical protein [Candidatus Woesearchaeota archaeon]
MDLVIVKEKEIPLLERKRVTVTLATKAGGRTPSRQQVLVEAAKKLNTKEENIVIRHIYSKFGSSISKAILHVYKNEKTKKNFEDAGLLKKHEKKAEEPKEEAPAPVTEEAPEAPTAEEPNKEAEEPKEESPKEESPKTEEKPAEEAKPEEKTEESPKEEEKKE